MEKEKRGKKRNFLKDNYIQSWDYIKESKNFIYVIMAIFFVFALIGFFTPALLVAKILKFVHVPAPLTEQILSFIQEFSEKTAEQILKFIQELLDKTKGMGQFELTKFILFNNLQSSFFGMIFGVLLGVFPLIAAIANGYLLGFVASITVGISGVSVLFRLLPHGIFELPAIFISLGLGLKFGMFVFQKNKAESFKNYLWNSLRIFLFIVVPLLVIAGIIEGSLIFLFG